MSQPPWVTSLPSFGGAGSAPDPYELEDCTCIVADDVSHDDECESDVVGPGLVLPCACPYRAGFTDPDECPVHRDHPERWPA